MCYKELQSKRLGPGVDRNFYNFLQLGQDELRTTWSRCLTPQDVEFHQGVSNVFFFSSSFFFFNQWSFILVILSWISTNINLFCIEKVFIEYQLCSWCTTHKIDQSRDDVETEPRSGALCTWTTSEHGSGPEHSLQNSVLLEHSLKRTENSLPFHYSMISQTECAR